MSQNIDQGLNSQGIPGVTGQNDEPIAPPPGFEPKNTTLPDGTVIDPQGNVVSSPVEEQVAPIVEDIVGAQPAQDEPQQPEAPQQEAQAPAGEPTAEEDSSMAIRMRVKAAWQKLQEDMEKMQQGIDPHPPVPVTTEEIDDLLNDITFLKTVTTENAELDYIAHSLIEMRARIIKETEEAAAVETASEPVIDSAIAALNEEQAEFMQAEVEPAPAPVQEQVFDAATAIFAETPADQPQPEPEPAPVQAAPQQTIPVTQETVTKLSSSIKRNQVGRVDAPAMADGRAISPIQNKSLEYLIERFGRDGSIGDEFNINGAQLREKGTGGIWDEGGATAKSGSVVLATDSEGYKLVPIAIRDHTSTVNGRHALVQVLPGYYIVMGGHQSGSAVMAVYRVLEVNTKKHKDDKDVVSFKCELVCYSNSKDSFGYLDDLATEHDKTIWTADSPAWKKAWERAYELGADTPAYTLFYREFYCDTADFSQAMTNKAFVDKKVDYPDMDTAYAAIDRVFEENMCLVGDRKKESPTLAMILNYLPDQNVVAVYLVATIYDTAKRSSGNKLLSYGRVILDASGTFHYPDVDSRKALDFTTLATILSRNGNVMACSFRRIAR